MKIKIKKGIKSFLYRVGFDIDKNFKIIPLFIKNVFKRNTTKRVLISYNTYYFVDKNNIRHSNIMECYTIAKIFDKLGFSVDVADHSSKKKIDYSKYEIIYGLGDVFEKSFFYNKKKIIRIFYSTGCNPFYSNLKTMLRIRDFYHSHGLIALSSARIAKNFYFQTLFSDEIIALGNNFVSNTYTKINKYGPNISNLKLFFYDTYDIDLKQKNISLIKNSFLWFGSLGLIHKGLDLLIDIFSKHKDLTLHICGASNSEKEFFTYYNKILQKSKNIINHGFVDLRSEEFKNIMNQCAFVIYPSVSEGCPSSVLNVIANGGLIPLITKSSGLDIDDFGFIIKDTKKKFVYEAIQKALSLSEEDILSLSLMAKKTIRENYSYENYENNLSKIIENIVKKYNL